MPTLIDLLNQHYFADAPGTQAQSALQRAWELATETAWSELYLDSLDDALTEELPHLSAYSGRNTQRPTRAELAAALASDLGEAGAAIQTLEQDSRAFQTELARAMQTRRLIIINRHNLFTDEYRQILMNLFDHAHNRFKATIQRNEPQCSAALASATHYDAILTASIAHYLERQFGVQLTTLQLDAASQNLSVTQPDAIDHSSAMVEPESVNQASLEATADSDAHMPATIPTFERAPESFPENNTVSPIDTELSSELAANIEPVEPELPAAVLLTDPAPSAPIASSEPIAMATLEANPPEPVSKAAALSVTSSNADDNAVIVPLSSPEPTAPGRNAPNRLRVLLATPADVQAERKLLTDLLSELDARSRTRFGLELVLVNPSEQERADAQQSPVELADIFIGVVWLQFGQQAIQDSSNGASYFAGTQNDFALALQQGSARDEGWLRTIIYRSIRPPLDLLHLDVAEYTRVQQFFEQAGSYAGDDLVRVYADSTELLNDARARLEAWIYNYAGDVAAALSEYGKNYTAQGQLAAALSDFEQAIVLYRELDRPEQELDLWLTVGELHQQQNNLDAARTANDTALRLARRLENDGAAAQALRAFGQLDARTQNFAGALENYQAARRHLSAEDSLYAQILTDEIAAHESIAVTAKQQGNTKRAFDAYHAALGLTHELNDRAHSAQLWQNLAELAASNGDWENAINAYDNALAYLSPQDTETQRAWYDAQANAFAQLAEQKHTAGDFEGAEHAYQSALRANAQGTALRTTRVAWFSALGALAGERTDWERGIEAYEQGLALFDSPEDGAVRHALLQQQAHAYQELGAARFAANDLNGAQSAYRDALSLNQELEARAAQGAALYHLGVIAAAQAQWQEANAYFTQAHESLEQDSPLRPENLRAQADALQQIGDAQLDAREFAQAEISFVQARANLEQLGMGEETGALLYRLGIVTTAQSRLPEALAYLSQARTRSDVVAQPELYTQSMRAESNVLQQFADMYRGAGDFSSAQGLYRQQLDLAQQLDDESSQANAYHSLGLVAADQSEWNNAIDWYDQALAHLLDPAQASTRALVQQHQRAAYEKLGKDEHAAHNLPQAELAYRSALTLAQSLGEREREADLLYTLGVIAIERENYDEALTDLRRALGIYNLLPSAPHKPQVIWNIGRAQRGQKRVHFEATLRHAQETRTAESFAAALLLAREVGDTRNAANLNAELGALASERADWDNALQFYDDALTGYTEPSDLNLRADLQRAQMRAHIERSDIARAENDWTNADAHLFAALDLARELNDTAAQGQCVYRRGRVAAGQARWNEAIDLYSDALERFDETDEMRATIEHAQAVAYQGLGNSERDAQNWEGAQAAYTQALTLAHGVNDDALQATLLTALGDVSARQGRWSDALAQMTQARALAQTLASTEQVNALDQEILLATRALKREQQADAERRGDAERAAHDFASAHAEYAQALALAEELGDQSARPELHAKLGFIATEQGAFDHALDNYRVAAGLYDAPENVSQRAALLELQAQTLQELGNRAGATGNWQSAYENYSQAVALLDAPAQAAQRNQVVKLQAVTLQNIGDDARSQAHWQQALDTYRRASGLYLLLGLQDDARVTWQREADALSHLAQQAHAANDFAQAQILYAYAAERLSEANGPDALRQVRAEQCLVLRDSGDASARADALNSARQSYRQALAIAEELDDRDAQAELYQRLGQLAARQGDWEGALLSYQYAAERAQANSETSRAILNDQRVAYQELGTTQRIAGDFAAAEASYTRAYTNAQTLDDNSSASELAFLLGALAADQNAWESALGYYQRALATRAADSPERADIQSYQAFAYQQLGDAQRANGQFEAAASAYSSALNIADETGDDTRGANVLYRVGQLDAAQGNWEHALDAYAHAQRRLTDGDDEFAAELTNATTVANQALQRQQLTAQLDHAAHARQEMQWDDAATATRAAYALAQTLGDGAAIELTRHDLVNTYAEKGNTLRAGTWWDEANDAYRESLILAREFDFKSEAAQREQDLLSCASEQVNALRAANDLESAEGAANAQLALADEFQNDHARADALMELGALAAAQGKWNASKDYYVQARPLLFDAERAETLVTLDANLARADQILQHRAEMAAELEFAAAAVENQNYDNAQTAYRAALDHARELDDAPGAAAIAASIVALAIQKTRAQTDDTATERAAQEQFALAQEFNAYPAQADALAQLGAVAMQRKQWTQSKQYLDQAHDLLFGQNHPDELAAVDVQLARVNDVLARQEKQAQTFSAAQDAHTAQDYDNAREAYRESLALARSLDDSTAEHVIGASLVAVALERANSQFDAHNLQDARASYNHALTTAQEFGDGRAQANALTQLGNIAAHEKEWHDAQQNFEQARAQYVEINDQPAIEQLDASLARVNETLARQARQAELFDTARNAQQETHYADAVENYRASLELAQSLEDADAQRVIGTALVAVTAEKMRAARTENDFDATAIAAREALNTAQEFGDGRAQADAWIALGDLYETQNDLENARETFTQGIALYGQVGADENAASAQAALARVENVLEQRAQLQNALTEGQTLRATEQFEQAHSSYLAAFQLAGELRDVETQAEARVAMGDMLHAQGQWSDARVEYQHASELYESLNEPNLVAQLAVEQARMTQRLQMAERDAARRRGDAAFEKSEWMEAASAYQEGLALAETLDDQNSAGEFQSALGDVASADKQWDAAANWYENAANNFASAANQTEHSSALVKASVALAMLGNAQSEQQEWHAARASYSQAAQWSAQVGEPSETAHLYAQLGSVATQQADFRAAVDYYDRAISTLGADGNAAARQEIRAQQAQSYQLLGDAAMDNNEFANAVDAYEHARALAEEVGDDATRAEVLHSLGLVYGAQGEWERARANHAEAYALVQDAEIPEAHLLMLTALANAEQHIGDLDAARANYAHALDIAHALEESRAIAETEAALGGIASAQEHWQDALAHYDAARQMYIAFDDAAQVNALDGQRADAERSLGNLLYGEGQWDGAQQAYQHALQLDFEQGRTDRDAALLFALGRIATVQQDLTGAIGYYDQAIAAVGEHELDLRDRILGHLAHTLQQEGKRAQAAGEWTQAEPVLTRALAMAEASDNFDQVADLHLRLGNIYTAQGRTPDALAAYHQAYTYDRIDGNALQQLEISNALAGALLDRGLAQDSNEQAEADLRQALTFAEQAGSPITRGKVLRALGETARARGDNEGALETYARAGREFATIEEMQEWRGVSQTQAELLRELAAQKLAGNEFTDAENFYRRALLLQQAADDSTYDGNTRFGLGCALLAQERYDEALLEFEAADDLLALDAPAREELRARQADALEAVGARAMANAEWSDARLSFTRAAAYRDELAQPARAGLNWQQLAAIAVAENAFEDAVRANEQALARLDSPETQAARKNVLHQQAEILASIGDAQQQEGDVGAASETYRRALALAQEQGDLEALAKLYKLLGSLASAQAQWVDASTEYQHALDIYQELNDAAGLADIWAELGTLHRQAEQFPDAYAAYEHARDFYETLDAPLKQGEMQLRLGDVQGDRAEWDAALNDYQAALQIYNAADARSAKAQVYRAMERAVRQAKLREAEEAVNAAGAQLDANEWQAAESGYREAIELYSEAEEFALRAQAQNQLGVALEGQGRADEALDNFRAALASMQALNLPAAQVSVLNNIGNTQQHRGLWHEAESAYEQALALNQDQDILRAGQLYEALAVTRIGQQDWQGASERYQDALGMYEKAQAQDAFDETHARFLFAKRRAKENALAEAQRALDTARAEDNLAEQGEILNSLGLMSAEDENWTEALDYYRQAIATFEQIESEQGAEDVWSAAQGTVLTNIGDVSQQIGAWHDADNAYTRALGLARQVGDRESEAVLLTNLGMTATEQAELPRALDLNLQALETYRGLGDATPRGELLERVGDLQLQLGQGGAAEKTYGEALNAALAANQVERSARLLRILGGFAEEHGAPLEALNYYDEALTRATKLQDADARLKILARQGMLYSKAGDWERAAQTRRAALDAAREQNDVAMQAELHQQLGEAAEERGELTTALQEFQAARELYETLDAPREQYALSERLGRAYHAQNDLARADEAYRAALAIENVETTKASALWQARAQIAKAQNRWSDAAVHYENALAALDTDAAPETRVALLYQRGDAALRAHAWHDADVSFNDALELANATSQRAQYGWGMNRLGLLAQAQHQTEDALENFQEAIEVFRESGEPLGEAHVLNNIARLKLETQANAEAELFAQAGLTIAQAFNSAEHAAQSLYVRALIAADAHELDLARRFLNQAIASNPNHWAAQLQLGNVLLAEGNIAEAIQQAEMGVGQHAEWELGAQVQLTIASLYQEDTRAFKANVKRTRARLHTDKEQHNLAREFSEVIQVLLRALEGNAENALAQLTTPNAQPALANAFDAQRFARTALLALSKTPRRFKGKPALVTYFAPPKPRARKIGRQRQAMQEDAAETATLKQDAVSEPEASSPSEVPQLQASEQSNVPEIDASEKPAPPDDDGTADVTLE